jgi:hypothetical protein
MRKSQPSTGFRLLPLIQDIYQQPPIRKKVIHKIWQLSTCDQKIKSTTHKWAQPVYKIIEALA